MSVSKTVAPRTVFEASDVADFCATDVATIYTWVKKGEIPFFKTPGGRLRFKREAVLDFLRKYQFPIPSELVVGRPRVLIIDHDEESLAQLRKALGKIFDVSATHDTIEGMLMVGRDRPDAIIFDAGVQGVDGVHCIKRLRAWDDTAHTRVLVFSSKSDIAEECTNAGAMGFVDKPDLLSLVAKLRGLLSLR